jgi:Na+/H+ antiporter NhaD/arsenite permease-like protein
LNLSLFVLLAVFVLIAARRIGRFRIAIWQAMLGGALAVLLTGQITPPAALQAIDWDVMLFLFGMFVIGHALVHSGYLYALAYGLFSRARSSDGLVLLILFGGGLGSALLMNDTLAIIGTPLVLRLAREHNIAPRLLLLALCFAVTLGSTMSPIGNPQNLLIALWGGVDSPFITFARHLALPTLLNLLLAYALLRWMFRAEFHRTPLVHSAVAPGDAALTRRVKLALALLLALIGLKVVLAFLLPELPLRLSHIALLAALPLLLSRQLGTSLRGVDWPTLVFFAAMFVLMAAVWQSGFFQRQMTAADFDLHTPGTVLGISVLLSQLVSNVPLVALYLPLVGGADTATLMALAAGSTVAGNLLLLGAASNIIVVQSAERHGATVSFLDFARVGIPLTALNVLVYWWFLI